MARRTSRRERRNPYSELIHLLNQRYQQEWRRAERLRDELDCLRGSGFWKAVAWMRWLKQRVWPPRLAPEPRLLARAVPYIEPISRTSASGTVSIVIPFRDQLALLKNCLNSLRASTYRAFEIILVDNGSVDTKTRRFLSRISGRRRVNIVDSAGKFNFSRLCNRGAAAASGDFLLFLNNDTELITRGWLEEMIQLVQDPQVGAVGGTLLYPDRTLQHVGLFPRDDGRWIHPYRGLAEDHPGSEGELRVVRAVPAVTAACLLVKRALFQESGGFDEHYPVSHNDVDLCERLRRRGMLVLISPHVRLLHFEGLSRGVGHDGIS